MATEPVWLPIEYRDFHDFPRAFFVRQSDQWLYVVSDFDAETDDYGVFTAFDMGDCGPEAFDDWTDVPSRARHRVGSAHLTREAFDPTRRRALAASTLRQFQP